LGEASKADAAAAIARHFENTPIDWLDRGDLRRRPVATLVRLWRVRG
jgi:hypothetical protein